MAHDCVCNSISHQRKVIECPGLGSIIVSMNLETRAVIEQCNLDEGGDINVIDVKEKTNVWNVVC